MFEIFQAFMAKPLEAILSLMGVGIISLFLSVAGLRESIVVLDEQQKTNTEYQTQVRTMSTVLTRVDENVKTLAANQEHILQRELQTLMEKTK